MAVYTFSTKNRLVALLATLVVLGAGAALLLVGLALLASLAVAGGVLAAGILAYRAVRGQRPAPLRGPASMSGLDPKLEVFPDQSAVTASQPNEDRRRLGPE
jgi:uncharacterized membrane protein YebE (DUF533 family)